MSEAEAPVDPYLAAWLMWAETMRVLDDVRGRVLPPLLAEGFDAFTNALGRPDVAPLVRTLLLELGPLPAWVRPAVIETVDMPPLDLLRAALFHLVEVALPPLAAGLGLVGKWLNTGISIDEARAAGAGLGELARAAVEAGRAGPLETGARLLEGALGHYVRFRMSAQETAQQAAQESMALAAAAARALEPLAPGTRLQLVRAVLRTWAPWAELFAAEAAPAPAARPAPAPAEPDLPAPEPDPAPTADAPRSWFKSLIAKVFAREPDTEH